MSSSTGRCPGCHQTPGEGWLVLTIDKILAPINKLVLKAGRSIENLTIPGSRMNKQRIHRLSASLLLVVSVMMGTTVAAASLNDIFAVAERLNEQARRSQSKIDALTEETRLLLSEYKTVLKEIEGLDA